MRRCLKTAGGFMLLSVLIVAVCILLGGLLWGVLWLVGVKVSFGACYTVSAFAMVAVAVACEAAAARWRRRAKGGES